MPGWSRLQSVSGGVFPGQTVALTPGSNLTANSKLIVIASVDSSTQSFDATTPVTDGTNTLAQMATATVVSGVRVSCWAEDTPSALAGTKPTITVKASTTGASIGAMLLEYSGLLLGNTTAMLDGTPGANSGTTTTIASPSLTTTALNELVLCIIGDWGGSVTFTIPSGTTADPNNINTSGVGDILAASANSVNGAESHAYTVSGATDWGQLLIAWKLAVAATPTGTWSMLS